MRQKSGQGKHMSNSKHIHIISSTLKTVASANLVTSEELANSSDKPLQELLDDKKESEQNPKKLKKSEK